MEQITLRIPEDALESLEGEAEGHNASRSEHIRDILESHLQNGTNPDRVQELTKRVEELEAENDRLRREKRLILEQREEHGELVEYVEHERSLQERREDRLDAPVWKRGYWWVFGRSE